MNKFFSPIAIIMLLCLNLFLLNHSSKLKKAQTVFIERLKLLNSETELFDRRMNNMLDVEFTDHPNKLILDESFFATNQGYNYFHSIAGPKLVLRFSELNCNSCVDSIVSVLKVFDTKYPGSLVYFSEYRTERDLYIFKHMNQIQTSVLNLKKDLEFEIENLNVPYLFLLDSVGQILHLHLPGKQNLQQTRKYLEMIGNRYWTKKQENRRYTET